MQHTFLSKPRLTCRDDMTHGCYQLQQHWMVFTCHWIRQEALHLHVCFILDLEQKNTVWICIDLLAHKWWTNHTGQYLLAADDSNSDAGGISCLYKIWSMIITFLKPVDTILNHFKLAHTFILRFLEIHFYSFIYIYISHAFLLLSIPTKILYTLLTSTIPATWSAQLSLPELIILYITWRLHSKKLPTV